MSAAATSHPLQQRVQPLLSLLRVAHGEGLRSVVAYGPAVQAPHENAGAQVLVVLDDASAAALRRTSPDVGQPKRQGLEPLFFGAGEIADSLDVFPLEFLDMQAGYVVLHGEDPLKDLDIPHGPLRIQVEEDLRSALHWLRQEVARYGHRPRPMRTVLAQSLRSLVRGWRGLMVLQQGDPGPAEPEALMHAVAESCTLDITLLERLQAVEQGASAPVPPELDELVVAYDALLAKLVALVDSLEA